MKNLGSNKWLCTLLAVVAVGMGVQTYYLVEVHRQLDAAEARAVPSTDPVGHEEALVTAPRAALPPADPFADLEAAEERMRSLFDGFYERFDRDFGPSLFGGRSLFPDGDSFFLGDAGALGPRVDLLDRGDHYELTVDAPGADESQVDVEVEGDVLIVKGTRSTDREESEPGNFMRRERHFGRFERRLSLPADADPDSVQTSMNDGVLSVTIQKSA